MKIRKPALNFIIDSVAFTAGLFLISTGILMRYLLPPGSGQRAVIWGMNRHEWGGLHFWIAVVMLSVLSLHLVLHWDWILCRIRGRECDNIRVRFRVGLAVIAILTLLAMAAAPLLSPVQRSSGLQRFRGDVRLEQPAPPPGRLIGSAMSPGHRVSAMQPAA